MILGADEVGAGTGVEFVGVLGGGAAAVAEAELVWVSGAAASVEFVEVSGMAAESGVGEAS